MLLVIDVGNTNTVLGLFDGEELVEHWRLTSSQSRTIDEYGLLLRGLFSMSNIDMQQVTGCIIACVVPPVQNLYQEMVSKYFGLEAISIGPGVKTGMPILYDNPREVGADRIVNAVAAFAMFQTSCIVVDFGTAITFDAVSVQGEYMGGSICPGIVISADALYKRASRLPRVELKLTDKVIGKNTVSSIQSGLVYGYTALVDGMVRHIVEEYNHPMRVIATGGLAHVIAESSDTIEFVDEDLTLTGLRILFERNHKGTV